MPPDSPTSAVPAPWSAPSAWQEINHTLRNRIAAHPDSTDAAVLAAQMRSGLETLFPLLDHLCILTCPWCPSPCCLSATIWFDTKDLLFLHLNQIDIPPSQPITARGQTCRYLSARGCLLPRIARPWICSWYLCPTQMSVLKKMPPKNRDTVSQTIKAIKADRRQLLAMLQL